MAEPFSATVSYPVSACVNLTLSGTFRSVNELEDALLKATHQAGRELYLEAFKQCQDHWLRQRSDRFTAQRWRFIQWITPFGWARIPVRVLRERSSGKYLSLSKVLFRGKATRLLSPAMEKRACEQATQQNFRPTARSLSQWVDCQIGFWLVWICVQFHGARRLLQLDRTPPGSARPERVEVLVSEIDSTWLKAQQRRRRGPVGHFPVHLGLHYTGRVKRYGKRTSTAASLARKHLFISIEPLATFTRQFQRRAAQLFEPKHHVLLSDGDEGIERQREQFFPQATWLLDRWHIAQQVRAFTGPQQQEFHRIMHPIRQAQSEAALQALAQSPLRSTRPAEFARLFGYLLGNREGIDNWRLLPPRCKKGRFPAVKSGSGGVEKNIETQINRRFKRQGRSWNPKRAQRLLSLKTLLLDPKAWQRFWTQPPPLSLRNNPP